MKRTAAFVLGTALLAACGTQPAPTATPEQPASSYAQRRAAPKPAEAPADPEQLNPAVTVSRADGQLTSLAQSLPASSLSAQSIDKSTPIILVHGLGGFGRDEMLGLRYWGGLSDTEADLRAQGYQVFTVSIGPVSSDWDRAAEAYAQIKGGCVDYGAAHSAEVGHSRHDAAKCYPGFYPEWDAEYPVNLIAHSMGAPTARTLVGLLEKGSPADAEGGNLFVGRRMGWVKAVMTISGANTGSPAADQLQGTLPFFKDLLLGIAAMSGTSSQNVLYDLDMGQWGLRRGANESFSAYLDRAFDPDAHIWKTTDQAGYSLSVEGAHRQNQWLGRSEHTRYFSWASGASYRGLITGWHYPQLSMNTLLHVTAYPYTWPLPNGLGNVRGQSPLGTYTYGPQWWENDGMVPVYVQHAPLGEQSEAYTGQPTLPGHWYRMGQLNGYDLLDITGNLTLREFQQFYRDQAAFLSSLD
ncbi:MAG: triacylglycerol lipase [Deinococcus sp.]|nr:triacylglycerol lipase [Deinococcus sp.]